jgi:hypothetical protein
MVGSHKLEPLDKGIIATVYIWKKKGGQQGLVSLRIGERESGRADRTNYVSPEAYVQNKNLRHSYDARFTLNYELKNQSSRQESIQKMRTKWLEIMKAPWRDSAILSVVKVSGYSVRSYLRQLKSKCNGDLRAWGLEKFDSKPLKYDAHYGPPDQNRPDLRGVDRNYPRLRR